MAETIVAWSFPNSAAAMKLATRAFACWSQFYPKAHIASGQAT